MKTLIVVLAFLVAGCTTTGPALVRQAHIVEHHDISTLLAKNPNALGIPHSRVVLIKRVFDRMNAQAKVADVTPTIAITRPARATAMNASGNGRRYIAISLQMTELIGDNADEYAFLIGHELTHAKLHENDNTPAEERRADDQGLKWMAAAGYDPQAARALMRAMAEGRADDPARVPPTQSYAGRTTHIEQLAQRLAGAEKVAGKTVPR